MAFPTHVNSSTSFPVGPSAPAGPTGYSGYPSAHYPSAPAQTFVGGPHQAAAYSPAQNAPGPQPNYHVPPPPSYPYPPPSYPSPPSQPHPAPAQYSNNTTVVNTQPSVVTAYGAASFGESPVTMTCPRCKCQIVTATIYKDGTCTWLVAGVLFFFVCWPCCLLPFCLDGFKDVYHNCPNCHVHLGTYRRM